MTGFWGARCDAFTLAFLATPLQLLDLCGAALDVVVYDVPDAMLHFRRTKREGGPRDVSFLDMFMGILHLPFTVALSVLLSVLLVVVKAPLLLLRAYAELWGRTTFYGFSPRAMRKNPLLALGFLMVNVCMPLLLAVVLVWTPLWAVWHGVFAAALIPLLGLPTSTPLEYFGLPWGYLLSKLLLLHRESNAFIVGSATNLVGAYGVSAENTEDESHVFDFKSAGKAFIVGIVSLVCVPVLLTLYLLAVAPAAIVTLLVRSISQFAAEEGSRPQKAGNLLMLLLLLPLILLAIALGIAVSPFLSVLPAQRAYLMRSFVGGFRGILRVVLLADFKITKILHQTDDVLRLSTLPEALWEVGLSDQQEEGGSAGPLGKLPRRDTTDRTDIDPMAEHVAAQMQARVYGVRGTMSAAAKAKAARLAAEGALQPAAAPETRDASPTSTNEDAVEGPAYAVPPHMRKHVSHVYSPGAGAPKHSAEVSDASAQSSLAGSFAHPAAASEVTEEGGSEVWQGDSQPPSRASSATAGGAVAVKRTVRTRDGESEEPPVPCCACCRSVDPLALPEEDEGGDGASDEEAPAYSAAFTITDAPAPTDDVHSANGTAAAASQRPTSPPIDVSVPLSSATSTATTPTTSAAAAPARGEPVQPPTATHLSLSTAARLTGSSPVRRWAAAGRARAKLPPHLRSPEAAAPPSVPSGKRHLYGMEEEEPLPEPEPLPAVSPAAPPAAVVSKQSTSSLGPQPARSMAGANVLPAVGGKPPPSPPAQPVSPPSTAAPPVAPRPAAAAPPAAPPAVATDTLSPVSHATGATQGSERSPTAASPVADSDTPMHASAVAAGTSDSAPAAADASTPGASSTAALHSVGSATSPSAANSNGGATAGFASVVAAARLTKSRSRAQEALQRARAALAEAEESGASSSPLVRVDPVQLQLGSRGRNRDRQADADLARAAPKPVADSP